MKKQLALALGLLFVIVALAGCGKSTKPTSSLSTNGGGASATDIAQVNDALAANPGYVNEDVFTTSSPTLMSGAEPAGGMPPLRPFRWWRMIDSTTRVIDTQFGDPDTAGRPRSALVTVTRDLFGTFNVVPFDSATHTAGPVVHKPLHDTWVRKLAFQRVRWTSDSLNWRWDWRVVGTSGVDVTSENATTHIVSVRIQSGVTDTTITDPLALHRLHRVLWLHAHDAPVHVTVTTTKPDDQVFLYRTFDRRRFTANGDNTYSLDFLDADDFRGMRNFGVNALSKGTLMDDNSPYDSQAWVLPYGLHLGDCAVVDRH